MILSEKQFRDEFYALRQGLERHYQAFYTCWAMGIPILTDTVDTAAVEFSPDGTQLHYLFNPEYWANSSEYHREFVVAHETCHILRNHGKRIRGIKTASPRLVNAALDIAVNHSLVEQFEYDRSKIDSPDKWCWVDTVFKDLDPSDRPATDLSFEEYLQLLIIADETNGTNGNSNLKSLVDDHSRFTEDGIPQAFVDSVVNKLGVYAAKAFINSLEQINRGTETGGFVIPVLPEEVPYKRKWESIIRRWTSIALKRFDLNDEDTWGPVNRRLAGVDPRLFLPVEVLREVPPKERLNVWFFGDSSGSCINAIPRFFKAARSIPPDKFNVEAFFFDTSIYPIDLDKNEVKGGGGTYFNIIEQYIQVQLKNETLERYPDAVFVLTDGAGNKVEPVYPERWHWLLTTRNSALVPPGSAHYLLSEFE